MTSITLLVRNTAILKRSLVLGMWEASRLCMLQGCLNLAMRRCCNWGQTTPHTHFHEHHVESRMPFCGSTKDLLGTLCRIMLAVSDHSYPQSNFDHDCRLQKIVAHPRHLRYDYWIAKGRVCLPGLSRGLLDNYPILLRVWLSRRSLYESGFDSWSLSQNLGYSTTSFASLWKKSLPTGRPQSRTVAFIWGGHSYYSCFFLSFFAWTNLNLSYEAYQS